MQVENKIKIYDGFDNGDFITGDMNLIVKNASINNRVKLQLGNIRIEVSADELQKAIRNATNV
jgi:hypothetical protein